MAFKGQPAPTTIVPIPEAKISDGKSVRVEVTGASGGTVIEAGKFYLLSGFFGVAMQSVTTGAGETAEAILNIEQAEYETDQTKEADRASMTVGKDIYWDNTEKHFTVTGTTVYAGKVTAKADTNGVIWFKLAEQPYVLDDVTTLAAQVGALTDLTTTTKTSVVAAVNEVGALAAQVGALTDLTTTTKTSVVAAVNEVGALVAAKEAAKVAPIADPGETTTAADVATQLNALITALTAAGLMSDSE